jgi:hypothetical protein
MSKRRSFSVEFMATVALQAMRGDKTAKENVIQFATPALPQRRSPFRHL